MNRDYVLQVKALYKYYGGFAAVKNISFQVARGKVFALLGHNGAGKTTLIKMIVGLVNPSSGQIIIEGHTHQRKPQETKMNIGYLPEKMSFYDNLTAWETIRFYAKLKGQPAERCAEVLEQVGLKEVMHKRVGTFSKGMQQRLGLAQAIIHRPQLLILDEPTTGLDPLGVCWLKQMIRTWNEEGTTVFFSSHNLADVQELAHRVAILCRGEMVALGTIAQLQAQLNLKVKMKIRLAGQYPFPWLMQLADKGLGFMEMGENQLTVTCNVGEKGKIIEQLLAQGVHIADFEVEEPGLDIIYQEVMQRAGLSTPLAKT
ncbi:heme ABC exporter ATP-binding protein CcmA [Thermanaeromonas sp. C210]|uniref:heme ABC exporter ATP-binding protein CcmA n=1 Tax=Thermanaeromonas sp. C210 TaxID=2731925 RepID=UPI00155CF8D9|nr:heme ABC exporter ATP-binding protein CcmA [Thermanaeromonas sp. C210]GFN22829.1 ABC transporter ATP-binding protein [Thermanaeromonas sp. C210]